MCNSELRVLRRVRHEFIVQLIEVFEVSVCSALRTFAILPICIIYKNIVATIAIEYCFIVKSHNLEFFWQSKECELAAASTLINLISKCVLCWIW